MSVTPVVKPLNVSKPLCSNNATESNACKVSSVSQLVKPSIISKSVCSSNVTKCNAPNNSNLSLFQ